RWARVLWVAWVQIGFGTPAATARADALPMSTDPLFKATPTDGRVPSGRIVSFDPRAITIATKDGTKEELPLERLVKLVPEVAPPVAVWEDAQAVVLPDGDRLMRVIVGSASDTSLAVRSELFGKLEVPLDSPLGLVLAPSGPSGSFDARWDQILVEPRTAEVVWLLNGDRLAGSFAGLDVQAIWQKIDGHDVQDDRSGAAVLGVDPALVRSPR